MGKIHYVDGPFSIAMWQSHTYVVIGEGRVVELFQSFNFDEFLRFLHRVYSMKKCGRCTRRAQKQVLTCSSNGPDENPLDSLSSPFWSYCWIVLQRDPHKIPEYVFPCRRLHPTGWTELRNTPKSSNIHFSWLLRDLLMFEEGNWNALLVSFCEISSALSAVASFMYGLGLLEEFIVEQ